MDPELDCLGRIGRFGLTRRGVLAPLTDEDCDALRRSVRFVWTSATLVGVVGRALRAAAAAAALKEALLDSGRAPWKATRAAEAAEESMVEAWSG